MHQVKHHPDDYEHYSYYAVAMKANLPQPEKQILRLVGWRSRVELVGRIMPLHYLVRVPKHETLVRRALSTAGLAQSHAWLTDGDSPHVEYSLPQVLKRLHKRTDISIDEASAVHRNLSIQDPLFDKQWHLFNKHDLHADINVTGVWQSGITGLSVTVAIIDDGIDYDHEDLAANFLPEGSFDFNDKTELPMPRLSDDNHGTRCAGEIAAIRNSVCGVGVAWDAKISGLRLLSGAITDTDEVLALNYRNDLNDIYSCSWGPKDDGAHVDGPNEMLKQAFVNGVQNGRKGRGSIFVFASGNGGQFGDDCNYDGYTNSIHSITVGAIGSDNKHQLYSESCSALLTTTYSSSSQQYICTTDVRPNKCTDRHAGTSAAAPIAVGMFALALSVRPDLTWRDMQHLTVMASVPVTLDDQSWQSSGSGRLYSNKYGYGRLDAYRLVTAAKEWQVVGAQTQLTVNHISLNALIPHGLEGLTASASITASRVHASDIKQLEHVAVTVSVDHQRRGDLEFRLVSPNDIVSVIGSRRINDYSTQGLHNWTFMSVQHFYEHPVGLWKLQVIDQFNELYSGKLLSWSLTLYGASSQNQSTSHHTYTDRNPTDSGEDSHFSAIIIVFVTLSIALVAVATYLLMCRRRRRNNDIELGRYTELNDFLGTDTDSTSSSKLQTANRSRSMSPLRSTPV